MAYSLSAVTLHWTTTNKVTASMYPSRREAALFDKLPQVTFDPPPISAAAKTAVASTAPELRR
jgi:hypothetical protein